MRRILAGAVVAASVATALAPAARAARPADPARTVPTATAARPGLDALLALPRPAWAPLDAIATFDGRPDLRTVRALERLGLGVVALPMLPSARVVGLAPAVRRAVDLGLVRDLYPNERLTFFDRESSDVIRGGAPRRLGFDGRGVTVAIVDTGVDGAHPALDARMLHNFKIVGRENLNVVAPQDDGDPALLVPVDDLPYDTSDTSSGHGTHVAGIVAADGTGDPSLLGVAPGARLVGYGTGDAVFIWNALAAFDDILRTHRERRIRVVNNSWGSTYRQFDPAHPTNVATRALHDAGVTVVFAAGNSAAEGTINPWSVAPWVISVASTTSAASISSFSSGGVAADNSVPARLGPDTHVTTTGDRIGLYHPDVAAPGSDVRSTGTPLGVGIAAPSAPGGTTVISGTSMAAPHVAGAVAVLLQARPSLTPDQVRDVLQVTAKALHDGTGFTHAGHGLVDLEAAIALVRRRDFGAPLLARLQAEADARVLAARDWKVLRSDQWSFRPLPVSLAGLDSRTYRFRGDAAARAVAVTVAFPSPAGLIGVNPGLEYLGVVRDAAGRELGRTVVRGDAGVSHVLVDLRRGPRPKAGTWTLDITGELGLSDNDLLLGDLVSAHVAQLVPQAKTATGPTAPTFRATGTRVLRFAPDGEAGPLTTPEGCAQDLPGKGGALAPAAPGDACRAATAGYLATQAPAGTPVTFTSAPIAAGTVVGGTARLGLWLADPLAPAYGAAFASGISVSLDAIAPDGTVVPIAAGSPEPDRVQVGADPTRATYELEVPATRVARGSRLRVGMTFTGVYSSAMRLLYGGRFADAGIELRTGTLG